MGRPSIHCEVIMTNPNDQQLNPGDEAAPGTPGTAEDICTECAGTGKLGDGTACPECGGSGRVVRGIGGG
jgi:RecJ-like exonuclease